jgi:transcriptional regulator with XRE-family HTH domain
MVKLLVAEREAAGLTQRQLADRVHKDPATVARIETGERNVSVLELVLLARALDRDPVDLFSKIVGALPEDLSG